MTRSLCTCGLCRGELAIPTTFAINEVVFDKALLLSLLDGATYEPWLYDEVEAGFRSGPSWTRFAAMGLLGRLWSPTSGTAAGVFEAMLAGWQSPSCRVQAWSRDLPPEVHQQLRTLLLCELPVLQDLLDEIATTRLRKDKAPLLADLWQRRDEVQSVFHLCADTDKSGIRDALDSFDAMVDALWPRLKKVPFAYNRHVGAASWQEVGWWWSKLAFNPQP